MPLTASLAINLNAELSSTQKLNATPKTTLAYSKYVELATGVLAGQADKIWYDKRTLGASANEDLDLTGTLVDVFGQVITMARVKALVVAAAVGNTNNVVVGAAAANPWTGLFTATGTVTLRPGAGFCAFTGAADAVCYAVTGGTGDLLRVANSAGGSTVDYEIAVIGASS